MAEFNSKEFIVTNIVNGIKKGTFAKEYGNIMAVKFVGKGFITFEEVAIIDAEIKAWEEAQNFVPTPPTETEDETILDDGEGTETEAEETETTTEIVDETEQKEPTEPAE